MSGMHVTVTGSRERQMEWHNFSDSPCSLCPRNCSVDREKGEKGYCISGANPVVARAALHMWEEPCISGKKGSGAVFFSGCSLRCVYCQNFEIAAARRGKEITIEHLSDIFLNLQKQGAANINLVTPDHYVIPVIKAVLLAREKGLNLPVVYNCSGYEKRAVIEELKGIVDIFLADFKYMEEEPAQKYSFAEDYPQVAKQALKAMVETAGKPVFDREGMMQSGVIVRHLLLPGHKRNAKAVIKYVYETYGDDVYLSLMNQYTPFDRLKENTEYEQLCRRVTKREYESVVEYALLLGVKNAFIQEGETAKESFIPSFDGEGV